MSNLKKRVLCLALAVLLVIQLVPAVTIPVSAAPSNPYKNNFSSSSPSVLTQFKSSIVKDVQYLKSDHEVKEVQGNLTYTRYPSASLAMRFIMNSDGNNGGAWSVKRNVNTVTRPSLSPANTFKSGNGSNWSITFSGSFYTGDPDAKVVVGANFGNKSQYIKYGGQTLTGSTGWCSMTVSVNSDGSIPTELILGGGNKGSVSGVYMYVIDDSAPSITGTKVYQDGSDLVIEAYVDENVYTNGNFKNDYADQVYVDVKIQGTSGTGHTDLRAWIYRISGNTLTFRAALDGWEKKDYTVLSMKPSSLPTLNYDYSVQETQTSGDWYWLDYIYESNPRQVHVSSQTYTFSSEYTIPISSAVISDYARNSLSLSPLEKTVNQFFDNTTPAISAASISVSGRVMNTTASEDKTSWDEKIDYSSLFLGDGQSATFTVEISEYLQSADLKDVKLALNVLDVNGQQVMLDMTSNTWFQTANGVPQSRLTFASFTAAAGMTMMSGHEGKVIRPVGLTYTTAQDTAGHSLNTKTIPKPAEQLYLDLSAPTLDVTAAQGISEIPGVGQAKTVQIVIADSDSGIRSTAVDLALRINANGNVSLRYAVTDSMQAPTEFSAYSEAIEVASGGTLNLSYTNYQQFEQTKYLHLLFPEQQMEVDSVILQHITCRDVLGNTTVKNNISLGVALDTVGPNASISQTQVTYKDGNAVVTAKAAATDSNGIAQTRCYWVIGEDAPPADYLEWDVYSSPAAKTFTGGTDFSGTFWYVAQDNFGNWSAPVSRTFKVYLVSPSTNVSVESDLNQLLPDPQIIVTGPEARTSDGTIGYTRVTVQFDDSTTEYVCVVPTSTSVNVFDFPDTVTWYKTVRNYSNNTWTSVSVASAEELAELKIYYGKATVKFENCYGHDMTPVSGQSTLPANTYSNDTASTLYLDIAPAQDEDTTVHKVTFDFIKAADGTQLWANGGDEAIKIYRDMTGIQIYYTIVNALRSDWEMRDVNFSASSLILEQIDGEGNVIRQAAVQTGLTPSASGYFTVPAYDTDGNPLETGAYRLKVTVVRASGQADTYTGPSLVLDDISISGLGLWKYAIICDVTFTDKYEVVRIGEDAPLEALGLSIGLSKQTYRDTTFAIYSGGAQSLTLWLGVDDNSQTLCGIDVGKVAGFKFWHGSAGLTQEEIDAAEFVAQTGSTDGRAYLRRLLGIELVEESAYPKDKAINIGQGLDLYLIPGVNTIYYQVKLESGEISPVQQFTIIVNNVAENAPVLDVSVDSYVLSYRQSEVEGQTNLHSLTLKVDAAYSRNGSGTVDLMLFRKGNVVINGETVEDDSPRLMDRLTALSVGDTVTLSDDSYSCGEYTSATTTAFVVVDEYGAFTAVTPEIGANDRTGSKGNNPCAIWFDLGGPDPWQNGTWTFTRFNEPADTFTAYESELAATLDMDLTGKFVSYTYAPEKSVLSVTDQNLFINRFAISSNDIAFGDGKYDFGMWSSDSAVGWGTTISFNNGTNLDLIDWDTATVTVSGDGIEGSVVLPHGTTGPNGAGLLTFQGGNTLTLKFSDVPTTDSALIKQRASRTVTLNANDLGGKDITHTITFSVYYVDAAAVKSVDTFSYNTYGVGLYLNAYQSNGTTLIKTGIFADGTYPFTYIDAFGNEQAFTYEIAGTGYPIKSIFSTYEPTLNPVTVEIDGLGRNLTVEEATDGSYTVTGSGTPYVTVVVTKNTSFLCSYTDENGEVQSRWLNVDNIVEPDICVMWDYNETETGNGVILGTATAWLEAYTWNAEGVEIIDRYSGDVPSFTFYPGEQTSYTFSAADLAFVLGDELASPSQDFTVELSVTLREMDLSTLDDGEGGALIDDQRPEVQLLAYSQQNGIYYNDALALRAAASAEYSGLPRYTNYTFYEQTSQRADATDFIAAVGWGSAYRFIVETMDSSHVKLFIKSGLYAQAPDYETGSSDTVDGVTLEGRLLTVTKAAAFTLFVVDELGQYTEIPMNIENVGEAPRPETVVIPTDEGVRIYLMDPVDAEADQVSGLTLTNADAKTDGTEPDEKYQGRQYILVEANGVFTLYYTYQYQPDADKPASTIIGSVSARVMEVNSQQIILDGAAAWSANKNYTATNQDVTAKLTFTQNVASVQVPARYLDMVQVMISGNQVSVRYEENSIPTGGTEPVRLTMTVNAVNGTVTVAELDAVSNIDKDVPMITVADQALSDSGRQVTLTMTSNEQALCRETGLHGTLNGSSYVYSHTVSENGVYTYLFTDYAGNVTSVEVTVNTIVTTEPALLYNTLPSDQDATDKAHTLSLNIGDIVYVKADRDCVMDLNGGEAVNVAANTWTAFEIAPSQAGVWPIIRATDRYGNVTLGQFNQVSLPDTTAPMVQLVRDVLTVKVGLTPAELEQLLKDNVIALDADEDLTVAVHHQADPGVTGNAAVRYTVTDSSGNASSVEGVLRIAAANEPEVSINGAAVYRGDVYVAESGTALELSVSADRESYSIVYQRGSNSVGQMKIGSTDILRDVQGEQTVMLPFNQSGYYTVCIITQSRDYYCFEIYVK